MEVKSGLRWVCLLEPVSPPRLAPDAYVPPIRCLLLIQDGSKIVLNAPSEALKSFPHECATLTISMASCGVAAMAVAIQVFPLGSAKVTE